MRHMAAAEMPTASREMSDMPAPKMPAATEMRPAAVKASTPAVESSSSTVESSSTPAVESAATATVTSAATASSRCIDRAGQRNRQHYNRQHLDLDVRHGILLAGRHRQLHAANIRAAAAAQISTTCLKTPRLPGGFHPGGVVNTKNGFRIDWACAAIGSFALSIFFILLAVFALAVFTPAKPAIDRA